MKKDIFNFHRFGKYFKSDIRTCAANFGLSLTAIPIFSPAILYALDIFMDFLYGNGWSGPGAGVRFIIFITAMACIVITMPVKCYGKLTEKQYGSQWLMIPASKLEKFMSMAIITCIVVPVTGSLLYLGTDALICAIDPTCGMSLFSGAIRMGTMMNVTIQESMTNLNSAEYGLVADFVSQLKSPWLYIDDAIQMPLPFLLGALCFKNGKTVKTFLALAAVGTVVSIICAPIMVEWSKHLMVLVDGNNATEVLFSNWIFRNIALVDTISDTVTNLALLAAIYFRIKTLRH